MQGGDANDITTWVLTSLPATVTVLEPNTADSALTAAALPYALPAGTSSIEVLIRKGEYSDNFAVSMSSATGSATGAVVFTVNVPCLRGRFLGADGTCLCEEGE